MKIINKMVFSLLLVAGALCLITPLSFAAVYNFDMPITEMSHDDAYYWGLSQSLGKNETIESAFIEFKGINDWVIEKNDIIYVGLFQDARYGTEIKSFRDNSTYGDYFNGKTSKFGTMDRIFTYSDKNEYRNKIWDKKHRHYTWGPWINPPEDFTYNFTPAQIEDLTKAMSDGKFAFGFDPDCHYSLKEVIFNIETETIAPTPEPATLSLLGLGLAGLLRFRKKRQ